MPARPTQAHPSARPPRFVQLHHEDRALVRNELVQGLMAAQAHTSPKYLYDPLGSRLFDAITELPEYYPTRTEASIFTAHAPAMAALVPAGATLVDLGAGNCEKAARLFEALAPRRYVAVDISVDYLRHALACLQRQFPALDMVGVGMDFSRSLTLPPEAGRLEDGPLVLFYPGSSIGNFTPDEALQFLTQAHTACRPAGGAGQGGGLLIGVDLVKPARILEPAYDDALGVTAAFNRNLLLHINALVGSDFKVADWHHVALFNSAASRIEMHLEAVRATTVRWPGTAGQLAGERVFASGERIHTENSYKWQPDDFGAHLQRAGFTRLQHWTDAQGWFAVFWAQA
jgi:L-histidine Nalpha-methyltransferase